ncbi:hypothetical protein C8R46DRAFT_1205351 [Mycena filopes]|nr:hypothetical protein C8R46DRAFT_1205351 [Mycena filopes]
MSDHIHILFAVSLFSLPLRAFALPCTPSSSEDSCPPPTSPLRIFATFLTLRTCSSPRLPYSQTLHHTVVLLVVPFLVRALCRRRRAVAPFDVTPLAPQASYSPSSGLPEFPAKGLPFQEDYKTPRPPPPSYSPT